MALDAARRSRRGCMAGGPRGRSARHQSRPGLFQRGELQDVLSIDRPTDRKPSTAHARSLTYVQVLGTSELRKDLDRTDSGLRTDFTAHNGLRVKILDPSLFRVYHLESLTHLKRHDSIVSTTFFFWLSESREGRTIANQFFDGRVRGQFLHTTCADDIGMKLYVAKVEGYWQDVDGYYTGPRKLISIEHLAGSREDVAQLFRTLLMLRYTTRIMLVVFPRSPKLIPCNPQSLHFSLSHPAWARHFSRPRLGRSDSRLVRRFPALAPRSAAQSLQRLCRRARVHQAYDLGLAREKRT